MRPLLLFLTLAVTLGAGAIVQPAVAHAQIAGWQRVAEDACRPRATCCKVCKRGQACGDSCISRKKTCHKAPGCACNAAGVCTSAVR